MTAAGPITNARVLLAHNPGDSKFAPSQRQLRRYPRGPTAARFARPAARGAGAVGRLRAVDYGYNGDSLILWPPHGRPKAGHAGRIRLSPLSGFFPANSRQLCKDSVNCLNLAVNLVTDAAPHH